MTAAGDVINYGHAIRATCLFTGLAAANNPPALVTDGVPCYRDDNLPPIKDYGICMPSRPSQEASIVIKGTGTGTVSGTFRLWGYVAALGGGTWVPLGTGADTTKGTINGGSALGEVKSDIVLHAEPLLLAGHFNRLYLEMTAVSGTTPSFEAWIVVPRTVIF